MIVEVPAFPSLYDAYDAEFYHFRRYSMEELESKLVGAGYDLCRKTHLGFLLFPAFASIKLRNKLFPPKARQSVVRRQAGKTSNSGLIKSAMEFESRLLSDLSLPFGIRALAVARRPK